MQDLSRAEVKRSPSQNRGQRNRNQNQPVVCHRCKQEGHYARGCAYRGTPPSGNYNPSQAWKETNMANDVIDLLTVNPTATYHIKGIINLYTVNFMVDTGAAVSLLDSKIWNRVKKSSDELIQWSSPGLVGVGGTAIEVHGTAKLIVGFEGQPIDMDVVVANLGETEAIVGLDFLDTHQSVVNTERQSLDIKTPHLSIPLYRRKIVVSQVEESTS